MLQQFGGGGRTANARGGTPAQQGLDPEPDTGESAARDALARNEALGERGRSQTLPMPAPAGPEGLADAGRSTTLPVAGPSRPAQAVALVPAQRTKTWPLNLGRGAHCSLQALEEPDIWLFGQSQNVVSESSPGLMASLQRCLSVLAEVEVCLLTLLLTLVSACFPIQDASARKGRPVAAEQSVMASN